MPLSLATLVPDYKASLHDAASVFKGTDTDADADFKRHLATAVRALGIDGKRSCTRLAQLTLLAGQSDYTAVPDDILLPKNSDWGIGRMAAWLQPAGALPVVRLTELDGTALLVLSPAPSAEQIAAYGSDYRYYYLATPVLTATGSSLKEGDKDLVILRAQVEAAREMVNRNLHKPVALSPGSGSFPANQTPAGWYAALLDEYRKAA